MKLFPRLSSGIAFAAISITLGASISFAKTASETPEAPPAPPARFSQPNQSCGVPVCDVDLFISELEKGSADDRASALGNLYHQNRGRSDVASLKNLRQVANRSYEVSKRLNDPERVLDWSVYLRETSLSGLLLFAPFEPTETLAWYNETATIPELDKDRQIRLRYEALKRWRIDVGSIVDLNLARGVMDFLQKAVATSKTLGDDEYVIREGEHAFTLLVAQLSRLYPQFEGVFEVVGSCQPRASDCDSADISSDRLVVMNSISNDGILTGVASLRSSPANFVHNRASVEDQGQRVRSTSDRLNTWQRPADMLINLDTANRKVQAMVLTSRYTGSLHLEGHTLFAPIQYYIDLGLEGQKPTVTGRFEGTLDKEEVGLIVRRKKDGTMIGTLFTDGEHGRFDFSTGDYVEHRGILNLVGFGRYLYHPTKLVLAYRKDEQGQYAWTGAWFTITGELRTANFKRVGDVDRP